MTNLEKEDKLAVSIETATNIDIDQIISLEEKVWISTYPNEEAEISVDDIKARFSPEFKSQRSQEIEREIGFPAHRYSLIKRDGTVIGYTHALKEEEYNDLVEIYLLPEYQGKGVGSTAIKKMFEWFGNNKPTKLEVATYNHNAIAVYEHLGFVLNPDLHQADDENWNLLPSGKRIPVVFMEKQSN